MSMHPLARELIEQMSALPPLETLSVDQARERAMEMTRRMGPGEAVGEVRELAAPGPGGDIPLRVYYPAGSAPFPALVFFHGGGWVVGNLDTTDFWCRALVNAAGCALVSVNYRHAPEHKYPAAAQDAFAATGWVADNADRLKLDRARIGVAGSSAGGNLAIVTALMARAAGGPSLCCQLLNVPVADHNFETESYRRNAEGCGLTLNAMRWFWDHYLARPEDGAEAHASPLRAPDLARLPPAFIATAEFDPLLDEGAALAQRLQQAGVPVEYRRYDGMIHMFLGPDAIPDMGRWLRGIFGRAPGSGPR